ncbi:putative membrane protein [Halobacteriovorax marinus SJ]|uniref:Membrane protein n=1 Tax=Halobacteriovorax marinus (strain ATCC BAA-682 / DSM 15412 / SJ) TaxID=862908 RepID=E1X5Z7_HALMS|nr:hypothetical protein [Halobacteriovorax marinus]CBW27341.1 putative membrane protein [Halobacteriovorax marinus SJ]
MEYLVALLPLFLFLRPKSLLRAKGEDYKGVVRLIEGAEVSSPAVEGELYRLAKLLLEVRKLYGAKANESLLLLKKEAFRSMREEKKNKSVLHGAYFQQFIMGILILMMILITRSMFETKSETYFVIIFLQVFGLSFLHISGVLLNRIFIRGGIIRLKNLLIVKTLSASGLSVGRVIKNIDWDSIGQTSNKRYHSWDKLFAKTLSHWQESGDGLVEVLPELEDELSFLRATGQKKFQEFMNAAKFISLLIAGFLSYFVYLFSFVTMLL